MITHRNLAAQLRPIEDQIAPLSQVRSPICSVADSQPPADEPLVRPIARDLRSAAYSRLGRVHLQHQPARDCAADSIPPRRDPGRGSQGPRSPCATLILHRFPEAAEHFRFGSALASPLVAIPSGSSPVRLEVLLPGLRRSATSLRSGALLGESGICRGARLRPHRDGAGHQLQPSLPCSAWNHREADLPAWM